MTESRGNIPPGWWEQTPTQEEQRFLDQVRAAARDRPRPEGWGFELRRTSDDTPEERYRHHPVFHQVVDTLVALLEGRHLTPTHAQEAVTLAQQMVHQRQTRGAWRGEQRRP